MRKLAALPALVLILAATGCKSTSAGSALKSTGSTVSSGASSVGSVATSLVNVNLSNVLNNLALDLHVDKANIPINAQIPITVAANVCGVSINILSIGARIIPEEEITKIVRAWFDAKFEGGRHAGRIAKISELEKEKNR